VPLAILVACAASGALCLVLAGGCAPRGSGTPRARLPAGAAANESAEQFITRVNGALTALAQEAQAAGFTLDTFITPDTQLLNAKANDRYLAYLSKAVAEAKRYDTQQLAPATARALMKLRLNVAAPAPDDARKRARLTQLEAQLEAKYGEGKYCPLGTPPARTSISCRTFSPPAANTTSSRTPGRAGTPSVPACARTTPSSLLWRMKARASSGSRTWASCGARATTCRPRSSMPRPSGCGNR